MTLTKNLVPVLRKNEFDQVATEFLIKYCPAALLEPMALPIESIAAEGLCLNVEYLHISDDFSELGKIFFTDGMTEVYLIESDEYVRRAVKTGTVFIDQDVKAKFHRGCERFTLAHECVHWDQHKMHYLLQQNDSAGGMAVAQRCPKEIFSGKITRTEEEWMEWQANGIAAAILMPKKTFRQKANEIVSDWDPSVLSSHSRVECLCLLAMELATYFEVSLQAAKIRLSELGYEVQQGG